MWYVDAILANQCCGSGPDPEVRGMDPDSAPDPSISKQNSKKNLNMTFLILLYDLLSLKNDVNVVSKR
jgi:hypothetical protein